jgi:hypothetical protein
MKFITSLLILLVFMVGCSKEADKSPSMPQESLNAAWVVGDGQVNGNVAFGEVEDGVKLITVNIKNEGVNISGAVTLTGPFNLIYQNCDNLLSGKSCVAKVSFTSSGKPAGEYHGAIKLGEYEGEVSAYIPEQIIEENLHITVNSIPVQSEINFGNLTYKQSIIKTLVVTNQGPDALTIPVSITGDYQIAYNNCARLLKVKNTCVVKIFLTGAGKSSVVTGVLKIGSKELSLTASVLGQIESQTQNSLITYYQGNNALVEGSTLDLGTLNQNAKHMPVWIMKNIGTDASLPFSLTISGALSSSNTCQEISLKPNQTCRLSMNLDTDIKGIFNTQILKDNTPVVAIQYQVRKPGDTIDCTDQLTNAQSALITWNGQNYTGCEIQSCEDNYTLTNNQCVANVITCHVDYGTGEQTWTGGEYSQCQVVACENGYHENNNACESDEISCIGLNGTGKRVWNGSEYGECTLNSCEGDYHLNSAFNTCDLNVISCPVNHGSGVATWTGTSYGDCLVTSCENNYHNYNNQCELNVIACAGTNGTGTKTWSGNAYGNCILNSCANTHHLNASSNTCDANVIACEVNNGTGTQTWNGTSYNLCTVNSCTVGFHNEVNQCVSDTKSCTFNNGAGQQTWTGSGYGACQYVSCNPGYTYEGGACINTRSCFISNGTGTQAWNGSSWGTCYIQSCNSPYYDKGDNLTCVNTARTVWNPGGFNLGQNAQTTLGSIRLVQQSDRHVVVYRGGAAIWASGTTGSCNGSCVMSFQGDGNLVSKQDNPFILGFASGTSGQSGLTFTFKDECPYYLVIHNSQRKAIWTNRNIPSSYYPSQGCGF